MQPKGSSPFGFPTARNVVDGRHKRSFTGYVPTPKGGGLVPFESLLEADLVELMVEDASVAVIRAQPETMCWRDGFNGRRRRYTPDFLAVRTDGTKVYREVKPHALLTRDPELRGRRKRIELECAARGASFEIWTEREIREDRHGWQLLRVATSAETDLYCAAASTIGVPSRPRRTEDVPGVVRQIADRLGLTELRRAGSAFVARSSMTGIPMAVLCDLVEDPETGMLTWKPQPRVSGPISSPAGERSCGRHLINLEL